MSKVLENIYSSLENIQQYLTSAKAANLDRKVLSMIEGDLVNLEYKLRLSSNYRPPRRYDERSKSS